MMQLGEDQYEVIRPLMPVHRGNVRLSNLDVINAVLATFRGATFGTPLTEAAAFGFTNTPRALLP